MCSVQQFVKCQGSVFREGGEQKTWCVQCLFWPAEVAEVIRTSHHWWTPKHQMVDTKHIPSKRSHQLVTLLGATTDMVEWREKYQTVDTKWWNTGHGHQMVKQGTPKHQTLDAFQGEALTKHQLVTLSFCHSKNAFYRILLPFEFPSLHSLPGYVQWTLSTRNAPF